MKQNYRTLLILEALFVLLMSLPWLVPHLGCLALVGFVPLLCAERIASMTGVKRFWIWHFAAFAAWNFATTFWVCNATVGGGIAAALINALQMSLVFGLFRFSKRRLGGIVPYLLLAAAWIAWERFYLTSAQISWPWLVLGNAFARSTHSIQWYEYTGTLGGSLWVWAVNLSLFGLMVALSDGRTRTWNAKARAAALLGFTLVTAGPFIASKVIYDNYEEVSEGTVDVLVAQPDFDPYEKFESLTQQQQTGILLGQFETESLKDGDPRLYLAPETFTSDLILNDIESGRTFRSFRDFLKKHPQSDLIFGASAYEYFFQRSAPSKLAREIREGVWVESHNSAVVTDSSGRAEWFHKSKLVPAVEMTPYPGLFVPIDNLLGGVMGRCVGQDEVRALRLSDGTPVGCAVCYESVYGEYCTGYVRDGATMMTVITNDAWWGDTPGYRQHLSYSSLRAIELRRDIARCANTGISCFIDQKGNVYNETQWWERQTTRAQVNLNSAQTFFVRHGDVVGRVCVLIFLLLACLVVVRTASDLIRPGK